MKGGCGAWLILAPPPDDGNRPPCAGGKFGGGVGYCGGGVTYGDAFRPGVLAAGIVGLAVTGL